MAFRWPIGLAAAIAQASDGGQDPLHELADLIDRPTCHLIGTTSEEGVYGPTIFRHELSCGHTCDTGWEEPPAYCNECGCMVVEKEEDNG